MESHGKTSRGAKATPAKPTAGNPKARRKTGQPARTAKAKTAVTRKVEEPAITPATRGPFPRLAVTNVTAKVKGEQLVVGTAEEQGIARVIEVSPARALRSMGDLIKAGLPFTAFKTMEDKLGLTQTQLADFLSITNTTLARRRKEKRLTTEESDRLIRYARLLTQAQDMMEGDQAAASRWLNEAHPLLDNESPLAHAVTELGARDVEDLITRVQFGVYS